MTSTTTTTEARPVAAQPGQYGSSYVLPITRDGRALLARKRRTGMVEKLALLGNKMEANTGTHWVTLRIMEATDPSGCFFGVMPPTANKQGMPGLAPGTTGLDASGKAHHAGNLIGEGCVTFDKGDLVKIEYDSDEGCLRWYKNGTLVGFSASGDAAPAGTHFAIGRNAGDLEVRLEDSSFMSESARGAAKLLAGLEEDESDSREERAFRTWINSLGLDTHVADLYAECTDGLLILEIMDAINPGVVDWKGRVDKKPRNMHAKVINCNYAVELGKDPFNFSLVGIAGSDIQRGVPKLVLALTWQLMRYHVIKLLSDLSHSTKQLTEKDVLAWANGKVALANIAPVTKLSDSSLASGLYVLQLIKAVAPRSVDMGQATPGVSASDRRLNARLAISCARRAGCMVFALWEDVTECKPKMLLVLFATLMQLDFAKREAAGELTGGSDAAPALETISE